MAISYFIYGNREHFLRHQCQHFLILSPRHPAFYRHQRDTRDRQRGSNGGSGALTTAM